MQHFEKLKFLLNEPFSDSISLGNVALSNPNLNLATGTAPVSPIPVPSINEGLVANNYKNPVSMQYSIGIQQQLGRDSVLSIAYVGNQNRHQTTSAEINLPPESDLASLTGKTGTLPYLEAVPYTGFNDINMFQNNINSHYNGFQVQLRSRLRQDLTFQGAFTWSRAIDPSTGGDDTNESPTPTISIITRGLRTSIAPLSGSSTSSMNSHFSGTLTATP